MYGMTGIGYQNVRWRVLYDLVNCECNFEDIIYVDECQLNDKTEQPDPVINGEY